MADEPTDAAAQAGTGRAGKYLTFALGDEDYGLEILKVREIIATMDITSVPRTPDFVKGVINLRGKVIPVFDLRLKLGMPAVEATDQTCIIVVSLDDIETGVIVDRMLEVLDIPEGDIEDAPSFGVAVETASILGMGKTGEKVTVLLDIDQVLSLGDVAALEAIS